MEEIIKKLLIALHLLKDKISMPEDYLPTEIPDNPRPDPSPFKWGTKGQCILSTRQILDEYGFDWESKARACATIEAESDFNPNAEGKVNSDGTRDWGLCQFNDGRNWLGTPYWIGKGADFSSIAEVKANPEKNVRVFAREFKKYGYPKWWYGYKSKKYYEVLPKYIDGSYKNWIV